MTTIVINDVEAEAKPGELLAHVARRNAAHIGFGCDASGICTMCECRILKGGENLSPVNDVEQLWLSQERLADGYRLGCQAAVRGAGQITTLTRAEELRRQLNDVINPPNGTNAVENLRPLLQNMTAVMLQHVGPFPFNVLNSLSRLGPARFFWPIQDLNRLLNDAVRVTQKMTNGALPQLTSSENSTVITIEAKK